MAAESSAPASPAAPSDTPDSTRSQHTPAHAPNDSMAHDISEADDVRTFEVPDADLPPLPAASEDSFLQQDFLEGHTDHEMKRQLMDLESSFLPEASVQAEPAHGPQGADDTYLFGGSPGNARSPTAPTQADADLQRVMDNLEEMTRPKKKPKKLEVRSSPTKPSPGARQGLDSSTMSDEPPTPADAYKTPAAQRLDFGADESPDAQVSPSDIEVSTSDAAPSSPSAEAALRNRSRDQSRTGLRTTTEVDDAEDESAAQNSLSEASSPAADIECLHRQSPRL
jgi:hypothetical protein